MQGLVEVIHQARLLGKLVAWVCSEGVLWVFLTAVQRRKEASECAGVHQ